MQRWRSSLLLLTIAAVCLPQTSTDLVTPEIRRVGDKLACKCGSCNNTVATCQMLQCHYSHPARQKIGEMQKAGAGDRQIVDSFVKESGIVALAEPPREGFSLLGWVMPFVAIALGLFAVWGFMKRNRRKPAADEVPEMDPAVLERYRERIDKDLAKLD